MKIGMRLALSFGVIVAMFLFAALLTTGSVRAVKRNATRVETERLPKALLAAQMAQNLHRAQKILMETVVTMDMDGYTRASTLIKQILENLQTFMQADTGAQNTEMENAIKNLQVAFSRFDTLGKTMVEAFLIDGPDVGSKKLAEFNTQAQTLEGLMRQFQDEQVAAANEMTGEIGSASDNVRRTLWYLTGAAIVLSIGIGIIITRGITQPIETIVAVANQIAAGNLDAPIMIRQQDEIGQLASAFRNMAGTLQNVLKEMNRLTQAIQEGQLDTRGNLKSYSGKWQELLSSVNHMIDAFVTPIKMTAESIQRIAQGDIPEPITALYKGDFNHIKQNMNWLITTEQDITHLAQEMASGNLTIAVQERSANDTLMQMLNAMSERLTEVLQQVKLAVNMVVRSSQELKTSAEALSRGTSQQAAATEEVSASMEEMTANIRQNADNARQTEVLAKQSVDYAEEGGRVVAETVVAMQQIVNQISVIQDIAQQTRLLSLNATIEASRAQDYGKSFGVVAHEVRDLANTTRSAAEKIVELASSSLDVSQKAGAMLATLVPNIQKTAELVQEISAASAEQTAGVDQINRAVQQLDQVTQENAATAEQVASSAEMLSAQATQLQGVTGFFKIKERTSDATSRESDLAAALKMLLTEKGHTDQAEALLKVILSQIEHISSQPAEAVHPVIAEPTHVINLEEAPAINSRPPAQESFKDTLDDHFERY